MTFRRTRLPRTFYIAVALLGFALGSAACQASGPLPEREESTLRDDVDDLSSDIRNVIVQDPQGLQELTEDLLRRSQTPVAEPHIARLAERLGKALSRATFNDADREQLAETLWQALSATEISERQAKTLQDRARTLLVDAGVPESEALSVVEPITEIQAVTTKRTRRWYELF